MTTTETAGKKLDMAAMQQLMSDPNALEAAAEKAAAAAEASGDKAKATQLREALARRKQKHSPSVHVAPGAIPSIASMRPAGLLPSFPHQGAAAAGASTAAGFVQLQAHVDLRVGPLFAQLGEIQRAMAVMTTDVGQLRVAMQAVENNIRTEVGAVSTQLRNLLLELGVKAE